MANREELLIIRAARAGQAAAQLSLGKRYLFGGAGLPKSLPTALYWLDRAAHQDERDAWILIGSHVPYETAQQAPQPSRLCVWYERAYDAGVAQAGLVLAKLVLAQVHGAVSESMRSKALRALQAAAQAGIAEAQWLLAQHVSQPTSDTAAGAPAAVKDNVVMESEASSRIDNGVMLEWATRAAQSGVAEARRALADHAWATGDYPDFVRWALPLARELAARCAEPPDPAFHPPGSHEVSLLSRCAHALFMSGDSDPAEAVRFWECAARAGDRSAQFSLGLWFARMDVNGRRIPRIPGTANYKKSIRWLSLAAEQGVADAWYALSRIYLKPECSQRNLADAQRYLERAAEAGHGPAQLELGISAWRTRRGEESKDVRAVYWLQKAAAQGGEGSAEARVLLEKIASCATPARWARDALQRLTRESASMYPLLAARIELAALFGLSRPEALLLDPKAADCGHCLLIDIRVRHKHSKRRLILLQTGEERQALDRIVRLFEYVDCGPEGPEGNYRQRLYRFRTLAP
jgi:TPR repeat protein